jgi:phosphoribosylanthranilate isomerase
MRVKVCGITRSEDVHLCSRLGVHAIGFNFFPGSRRYVTPEAARKVARNSAPFLYRVGIFVNEPDIDKVKWIAAHAGLNALQFHGDESPAYCALFESCTVIKAFRVAADFRLEVLESYPVCAVLLDGFRVAEFGGTGMCADWQLAAQAALRRQVILSGGLNAANVREAVRRVQPVAVDVCSGVESNPGIKDPIKLAEFMEALRER